MKKRLVCILLTFAMVFSIFPATAFASEELSWQEIEEIATTEKCQDEYYKIRTPKNEDNALYVEGKAQASTKMLLITLHSFVDSQCYARVFVEPDADGCFSVRIDTTAGNCEAPTASCGTVFADEYKVYDSMPGYCAMQEMPIGLYRLNIAAASTDADCDIFGSNAKWDEGTLSGDYGYVFKYGILSVSGADNNPKLIEFTESVNDSVRIQSSADLSDPATRACCTDVYLRDFAYILRDSDTLEPKPLTDEQVEYIRGVAEEITEGAATDFEKLKRIYDYVAENFYYDDYALELYRDTKINIQCCDPYDNLYKLRNRIAGRNSTSDGKVATVCEGYTSLIMSLCRSLGIPSRAICGSRINFDSGTAAFSDLDVTNHFWAEVYADDRWVTVDANMGAVKSWSRTSESDPGTWNDNGITIQGFDMSYVMRTDMYRPIKAYDETKELPFLQEIAIKEDEFTGKPKLTWTPIDGYSSYYIYRGTKNNSLSYYDSTRVVGSYIDVDAQKDQTYYYYVRPVDESGNEAARSTILSGVCRNDDMALVYEEVMKDDGLNYRLRWTSVEGAVGYNIYRGADITSFKLMRLNSSTSFSTTLKPDTAYCFYVRPVFEDGSEGTASNMVAKDMSRVAMAVPTVSAACSKTSGKPCLSWNDVSAMEYEIWRAVTKDGAYEKLDTTSELSYEDESAEAGMTYFYKVRAVAANEIAGQFSEAISVSSIRIRFEPDCRISVSGDTVKAGEELTLSVSIENNPGIMAMALGIEYDESKLELLGVEDGILNNWYYSGKAVWFADENNTENGEILKLKFKVLDDAEDGEIEISMTANTGDIANCDEEAIVPELVSGKVTVVSVFKGDLNNDGMINALDLVKLARYLSGANEELCTSGDLNGDGWINALDLIRLRKFISGADVELH